MPRLYRLIALSFVLLITSGSANAFTKFLGKTYCSIRHPVAMLTSDNKKGTTSTCESQHIIQRQSGGIDKDNTIWISTAEHDYLDRYGKDRPWAKERPWFNWGDDNAERAYMMGTYSRGFHFIVYDHKRKGLPTLVTWDGASHFIYLVSSVSNFITKEMTYIGYQREEGGFNRETQYIDAVIGIGIDLVEVTIPLCQDSCRL
jgi:hypothetical protein